MLGVYTGSAHTYPTVTSCTPSWLSCWPESTGGRLALSEETEDLRWYALDALPQLLFEPHLAMLADLATGRRATWD